ncbi:hypothetical protein TVAG_049870 [Trichomonas vaginalis G3]|uniref:Uncharacterized protein n=1 Tax=Trichomonas vaginalis (strain ATCC PRA-98 / G3) TaxID=412133 RepID=A2EVY2_TRIV3|nr:hypothetical protein TVAG_049870 [Trichomonas vaginalis G3]|eukprot:XP_001315426.1 hypothetical protein [Trichomonas vaginalis G3]
MEESSKMKIGKLELYGNLITKGSLDIDVSSIGNFPNLSGNIQAKTLILEFGKNSNYLIDEKFPNIEHCDSVEIYSDNIFLQNCKLLSKILFFSNNLNTEGTNLITNLEIHSHDFVLNGIIKIGKSFVFDGKSILSNSGIAQIFGDAKIKAESLRLGSTDLIPLQEGKAILDKDVSQIYTSFMALGKMNLECKDIWLKNAVLYGRQQLNVFNENLIENKTGFIASDGSIYIKSSKLINGESDNTAFPHYSLHRGTIVTPESIKDGHSLG